MMDTIKLALALLISIAVIVAFYVFADQSLLYRVVGLLAGAVLSVYIALQTEKGRQIWLFFQEAQIEVKRVVWPTRQETVQTTLIVSIVVIVVAMILFALDAFLKWSIDLIMGIGG